MIEWEQSKRREGSPRLPSLTFPSLYFANSHVLSYQRLSKEAGKTENQLTSSTLETAQADNR